MPDHNDAPDEHTPEGAIPTPDDGPGEPDESAGGTMIGEPTREVISASGAVINVADVEETIGTIADEVGEQEPLPVGANDPSLPQPLPQPPGMPREPDEVDEQIAAFVNAIHNDDTGTYVQSMGLPNQTVRPDQANVTDAFRERIYDRVTPRTPREALLVQVQRMRRQEREAALAWATAVREQQEARDAFEAYRANRLSAMDALAALGMTDGVDFEGLEADYPHAKPMTIIADDLIV